MDLAWPQVGLVSNVASKFAPPPTSKKKKIGLATKITLLQMVRHKFDFKDLIVCTLVNLMPGFGELDEGKRYES